MDVASIIAAKRQTILKSKNQKEDTQPEDESHDDKENKEVVKGDGGSDDSGNSDSDSNSDSDDDDDSDSGSDSGSSTSSSSDEEEDEGVDDADREMEQDVLKTRIETTKKKKKKTESAEGGEEEAGNDEVEDDTDHDDDENEDSEEEEDADVDDEDQEEAKKAAEFFDSSSTPKSEEEDIEVFAQLTLSRPLLRGVAAMGYTKPTPIQSSVIPVALGGRDICASAVTGSGKTAAFVLPILERLLYRSATATNIQALILTPTRELAAQIYGMISTLAQFTKITSTLIVGGSKNVNAQQAQLRARPQIVIATPGRLLDHVMNSTGVSLEDIEFLVLDEADRLLDLGFQEEVNELIGQCATSSRGRQTMLFSATMNTKVDDLIQLSLKRPIRIRISSKDSSDNKDLEVAPRLEQEFIRVRQGNEGINREAMLLSLLTRTFTGKVIVFFDTKVKAHRLMILCGLCGMACAELHGNLTQQQRLEALEKFRTGEVDILLATDLAARGLDISRVETVINFEMPTQVDTYIHRIGRTARAGRGGKSCTLIGEGRRHLMKEIMKDANDKNNSKKKTQSAATAKGAIIRSRAIPSAVIGHFVSKIESLETHVEEVLQAETVAKMDRLAEMEAAKAQNMIAHSQEIGSRPQRQWFVSENQKKETKEAATLKAKTIAEKVGTGLHRMTRKKRRAREAKQMLMEHQEEMRRNNEEDGGEVGGEGVPSMKQVAREKRREQEDRERERNQLSINDMDMEREAKRRKKKGVKAQDAFGDSSLFGEEKIAYAPKKQRDDEGAAAADRAIQSTYNFRGYDPSMDGKKKPKKKGMHKFKSKSKYKRR